jgi:hypothetical protein
MKHLEAACRRAFEKWAKEGTKPFMYPLKQVANGEYVSPFTEQAWRAYKAGWMKEFCEAAKYDV